MGTARSVPRSKNLTALRLYLSIADITVCITLWFLSPLLLTRQGQMTVETGRRD